MERTTPPIWRLGTVVLLLTALFALFLLIRPGNTAQVTLVDDLFTLVCALFSLGLCFLGICGPWPFPEPPHPLLRFIWPLRRLAAILFGLGVLFVFVGDVIRLYEQDIRGHPVSADSPAILVHFGPVPCIFLAILLLGRRPLSLIIRLRLFFDGLMIAVAAFIFGWYHLLGPALTQSSSLLTGSLLAVVYPLSMIVLLLCALLLWLPSEDEPMRLVVPFLFATLLVAVIEGSVYGYQSVHGGHHPGQLFDVGWALSTMLLGLSAYAVRLDELANARYAVTHVHTPAPVAHQPAATLWRSLLPYVFIPAVSIMLAITIHGNDSALVKQGVYVGVGLLAGLALLRQVVALLESREYARSLERLNADLHMLYSSNDALAAANRQLELVATTDGLTNLPNRYLFNDRLDQALKVAQRMSNHVAILLMDLDHFKEVNDTLGHHYGDLLLKHIGIRLQDHLRDADTAARLGGDEFAVLLPETDGVGAVKVAHALLAVLRKPLVVEGHAIEVSASIGIALYPDHGIEPSSLLRCADVAMYVAKRTQSGYAKYTIDEDQHSKRRLTLLNELRQAIAQNHLQLYYQPKVRLADNQICGVEALVRWRHADHGLIMPDQFIPLAEQTGQIIPLTQWVLDSALRQCRQWRSNGLYLAVAVNLSTRILCDAQFPDVVSSLLSVYDVEPAQLTLEITESMLMADPAGALEVLTRLDAIGVRLAIDDFGTGYSSLEYLTRLPVDEVKLDKSFVLPLSANRTNSAMKDRVIVRAVSALAHALGLQVVAEGVETQVAWELLSTLHCDIAQGYYLSGPLNASEMERWAVANMHRPLLGSGDSATA